jgi:hypothetical protein
MDRSNAREFTKHMYLGVRSLCEATLFMTYEKTSVAEGDGEVDVVRLACRGFGNESVQ